MSGYSGTPISRKLGIKKGHVLSVINAPNGYKVKLQPLPDEVSIYEDLAMDSDIVHAFCHSMKELAELYPNLVSHMHKSSSLWISWPKKSSGIRTDINRDVIREFILEHGLVDVKVASYDETYSCLKCVYRLRDR